MMYTRPRNGTAVYPGSGRPRQETLLQRKRMTTIPGTASIAPARRPKVGMGGGIDPRRFNPIRYLKKKMGFGSRASSIPSTRYTSASQAHRYRRQQSAGLGGGVDEDYIPPSHFRISHWAPGTGAIGQSFHRVC